MAWHKTHKKNTKDKILTSAATLFTTLGFDNVSIDKVMKNADMTRGAFYAHFNSKSDLYAQALVKAATLASETITSGCANTLDGVTQRYLSKEHRDERFEISCPIAFLVTDINQQEDTVKSAYTNIFRGFVKSIESQTQNHELALQSAVLMIGGLALSKALNDKSLSDKVLSSSLNAIKQITNN